MRQLRSAKFCCCHTRQDRYVRQCRHTMQNMSGGIKSAIGKYVRWVMFVHNARCLKLIASLPVPGSKGLNASWRAACSLCSTNLISLAGQNWVSSNCFRLKTLCERRAQHFGSKNMCSHSCCPHQIEQATCKWTYSFDDRISVLQRQGTGIANPQCTYVTNIRLVIYSMQQPRLAE